MASSTTMPMASTMREQRDGVRRIAHGQQHGEGADQADRHGDQRNDGRADAAEEQEHHDDDQHEGLDQGVDHLLDRQLDEDGRVVDDLVFQPLREAPTEFRHGVLDLLGDADGIGARRQVGGDQDGGLAVGPRLDIQDLRPKLEPRHVTHPQHRAVRVGADDDVAEFLRVHQPALGLDIELEGGVLADRLRADPADRRDAVLLLDRRDDVGRREAQAGQPVHLEPDPHRVVERAEHQRVADAADPLELIEDVDRRIVADEQRVLRAGGRPQRDDLQHRRGFLLDRQALLLDLVPAAVAAPAAPGC